MPSQHLAQFQPLRPANYLPGLKRLPGKAWVGVTWIAGNLLTNRFRQREGRILGDQREPGGHDSMFPGHPRGDAQWPATAVLDLHWRRHQEDTCRRQSLHRPSFSKARLFLRDSKRWLSNSVDCP